MTAWTDMISNNMGQMLCDDMNTPELRNPGYAVNRGERWYVRMLRKFRR